MLQPTRIAVMVAMAAAAFSASAQEPDAKQADAENKQPVTVQVFDALTLTVPENWQTQATKSRIVEHEFTAKHGEGEDAPTARVTMMAAGGDVQLNIDRWKGQFSEGGEPKVEKIDAEGHTVHLVELEGTFKDSMGGGPFAGGRTVSRKDYGMLGAIIEMKDGRKYFIKLTGPKAAVEANREGFKTMLKSAKS